MPEATDPTSAPLLKPVHTRSSMLAPLLFWKSTYPVPAVGSIRPYSAQPAEAPLNVVQTSWSAANVLPQSPPAAPDAIDAYDGTTSVCSGVPIQVALRHPARVAATRFWSAPASKLSRTGVVGNAITGTPGWSRQYQARRMRTNRRLRARRS